MHAALACLLLSVLATQAAVPSYPPNDDATTPWFTAPRATDLRAPANFYGSNFLNTTDSQIFRGYALTELGEFDPFGEDGLPNVDIGVVFGWDKPGWDREVCDMAMVAQVLPQGAAPSGSSMFVVQRAKDMALDVFPDFDMAMQRTTLDALLPAWLGEASTAALTKEHVGLTYRLYLGVSNKAACLNETHLEHGPYAAFSVSNRYAWTALPPVDKDLYIFFAGIPPSKDNSYSLNNDTYYLPDERGSAFFFNFTTRDSSTLTLYLSPQNQTTGAGKLIDASVSLLAFNGTGYLILQTEELKDFVLGDQVEILKDSGFAGATNPTVMIQVRNPQRSYDEGYYDMAITVALDQPAGGPEKKKKKKTGLASWVIPVVASAGGLVVLLAAAIVYMKMRAPPKDSYAKF